MARHASELQSLLVDESFDGEVYPNEPMARHTTYRIGGPARFFVQVDSVGALRALLGVCENSGVSWYVVGKGSNLLVSDEGFPGVVVTLGRDFRMLNHDEAAQVVAVGAGHSLSALIHELFRRSLGGLEFAVGTPGTVGGALRMNAGTRREWIGSSVRSVTTVHPSEGLKRYASDQLFWDYRRSSIPVDEVVVECELSVKPVDPFYIRGKMEASLSRRSKAQPLSLPSCGSVFRNPEGASAAQLIESCGLKGCRVGGAEVSGVHANFIVNADGATAYDVVRLIKQIQAKVHEVHGVELQPEVRFLGFA